MWVMLKRQMMREKKLENYVQIIFYKTLLRFFFAFPN